MRLWTIPAVIREYRNGDEAYILPDEPGAKGSVAAEKWKTIVLNNYPVAVIGLKENVDHTFIFALIDKNVMNKGRGSRFVGRDLRTIAHSIKGCVKTAIQKNYPKGERLMRFAGFKHDRDMIIGRVEYGVYILCRG